MIQTGNQAVAQPANSRRQQAPTIRLAITAGEPAGIGPDLVLTMQCPKDCTAIVIADPEMLQQRATQLGIDRQIKRYDPTDPQKNDDPTNSALLVHPVKLAAPAQAGKLDTRNADYVLETIRQAVNGCRDGSYDAMVTAPLHKGVINDAGIAFTGHTEFIADMLAATPLMVLVADQLRVALVTTHLPLSNVAAAVTHKAVFDCLKILHRDLQQKFAISNPHILVCGLNPHAGESGHLGREEIEQIEPAVQAARRAGINATGPLPADTLFTPRHLQNADAVLSMFHDQGLPVLKYAGFGNAVNITLGLPLIRTSVDHGTALDLAGSGDAHGGSLQAALTLAGQLAMQALPSHKA